MVHNGQKSVTNKFYRAMGGIEGLECSQPNTHVPSSATNKVKKSFNFETGSLMPPQEMSSIENQSCSGQDTSAASRTKK